MTKLYNTSFREQEGKYVIDGYPFQKPLKETFTPCMYSTFEEFLTAWQESKQSIEVHSSQIEGFKKLVIKSIQQKIFGDSGSVKQGIEIPDEMVEIRNIPLSCKGANFVGEPCNFTKNNHNCLYDCDVTRFAFLKQETKPVVEEESSQQQIWQEIFMDLDIWSRSCKSSKDTGAKIEELKSKFTITKK